NPSGRLVEHFFRHESANLVAVLTRAFGIARLDLVEDMVQSAMIEAMQTWRHRGIPDNPAGWIHRVARNRILDALRREKIHQRAVALAGQSEEASESLLDEWLSEEQIPDSLLRMMFVCCHPSLDRTSQIALTLKVLCGFGMGEIARGLLMSKEAVKKRIQRAKQRLAEQQVSLELPQPDGLQSRLDSVHEVLYLMFNEGYSTTMGAEPIRDDICEEAARLCHMLCQHQPLGTPTTFALLALMLFHAARLDSRTDDTGAAILLEDQDRSLWDRKLIAVAEGWLARSKVDHPTLYHLEAAIAMMHCRADGVEQTDWKAIVRLYDRMLQIHDSPVFRLNRAIAVAQSGDLQEGLAELESIRNHPDMKDYFLLECAVARLHELSGDRIAARASLNAALGANMAAHERTLLERRLRELNG
ncbi:MAG: sigma-70 family RNA polymerase sigma factor, partial [Planctomycetota bacterium]